MWTKKPLDDYDPEAPGRLVKSKVTMLDRKLRASLHVQYEGNSRKPQISEANLKKKGWGC